MVYVPLVLTVKCQTSRVRGFFPNNSFKELKSGLNNSLSSQSSLSRHKWHILWKGQNCLTFLVEQDFGVVFWKKSLKTIGWGDIAYHENKAWGIVLAIMLKKCWERAGMVPSGDGWGKSYRPHRSYPCKGLGEALQGIPLPREKAK